MNNTTQSRDNLIKELQKYSIPFEPFGENIAICCPFGTTCGGVNGDVATFLIKASTRSGVCRSCSKTAPFSDVLKQFGIGSTPESLPKREARYDAPTSYDRIETKQPAHPSFKSQLLRVGEILNKEYPDEEWLIEDILPLPSVNALSGMPGHGKTFVTIHIAQCVAKGLPVFGKFPSKQAPVLIISEEDYPKHLKRRFESLGITEGDAITYLSLTGFKADNPKHIDEIVEIVREATFKLVIIDCLRRVHDQDENDSRGMAKVAEGLRRIAKEGVAVLYTHHHRKQEDFKPNNPTVSLRGSTEIQAAIENHFALERKENEDVLIIRQPKSRNAEALKPFEVKILTEIVFNAKKNKEETVVVGFEYVGGHDEKKRKSEEAREGVVTFLASEGVKSRQQIVEAIKPMGYGEKAIDTGIHDAEAAGEIELVSKNELPHDSPHIRQRHYRIKEKVDSLPPLDGDLNVAISQLL
jgi:RNase H-fold protein (predicted Holliday junction resolvase)